MAEPERLRAADAKAQEAKQSGDAEAQGEHKQRQQANAQGATQLVSGLRAAKEQAVPGLVGRVQEARVAGKLSADASPTILQAMTQAIASALLGGVKNDEVAAAIRACCGFIGRGETIESIDRDMTRLVERLERVLGEKAPRATDAIFSEVPTAEQVAEKIRDAGERALQLALGDPQGIGADLKHQAADAFNARHPKQVARFNELTHGMCAGGEHGVDAAKVIAWQTAHGVDADGKVGPKTLDAAKAARKQPAEQRDEGASQAATQQHGAGDTGERLNAAAVTATAAHVQPQAAPEAESAAPTAKPKEPDNALGDRSKIAAVYPLATPEKEPSAAKHEGAKGLDAIIEDAPIVEVKTQLHVEEFFAKVPNNDKKKHAYKALVEAHKNIAKAKADAQRAQSAEAKAAAEKKLAAAEHQLDTVKAEIVPMVARAFAKDHPDVHRVEDQIKEAERHHKEKMAHQLKAELEPLKATLYEQALAEIPTMKHNDADADGEQGNVLDPAETKITHYDYAFPDGDHVKLRDHVASYATAVALGVDNEGRKRDKQRPHSDVKGTMKAAGLSESKQKILGAISEFEGEFDTINTYDRATLTWGFVQWTGGHGSDLTKALAIIKEKYPEGFARAFQQYGIDVEGKDLERMDLVVTMPDGSGRLQGEEAAAAIMKNPKLAAAMVHAGRDADVQKGEVKAAEHFKIDEALAMKVPVGKHSVMAQELVTSEYGVGLLANTFVHSGGPKAHEVTTHAIATVLKDNPYVPGDDAWAAKAEAAIIKALAAIDGDRAAALGKKLNKSRGSYQP